MLAQFVILGSWEQREVCLRFSLSSLYPRLPQNLRQTVRSARSPMQGPISRPCEHDLNRNQELNP